MTLEDALEELEFMKDTTATIEINPEAYNKALKSLEAWIKINKALDGNIEALYQLDTAFDYVANIICDFLETDET